MENYLSSFGASYDNRNLFSASIKQSGHPRPNSTVYMVNSVGFAGMLKGANYYMVGNNSGQVNYKYYSKLKPSIDQVGKDAITLQL